MGEGEITCERRGGMVIGFPQWVRNTNSREKLGVETVKGLWERAPQ